MAGGYLEVFKFGCYISIPILMTFVVAGNPEVLEKIIKSRSYVVYPPEGPRPPTADEMHAALEKGKK